MAESLELTASNACKMSLSLDGPGVSALASLASSEFMILEFTDDVSWATTNGQFTPVGHLCCPLQALHLKFLGIFVSYIHYSQL